jgi:hypothetical protein
MKAAIHSLSSKTVDFLSKHRERISDYQKANEYFFTISGIHKFFREQQDFWLFLDCIHTNSTTLHQDNPRREYGDFQTLSNLTDQICSYLSSKGVSPEVLIEPTFGKGSFVISGLNHFSTLKTLYGIEIYEPYYWNTKFKILEWALQHPDRNRPQIFLFLEDIFVYNFKDIASSSDYQPVLVIGNPPWVTNAELGKLHSNNLPEKRNFKVLTGLDALTGKSNFDISENIMLMMLEAFSNCDGHIAMLVKNSVIKTLLYDLPNTSYTITNIQALHIDTKKYFNASVEASLFEADFHANHPAFTCKVGTIRTPHTWNYEFGWVDNKFVSDSTLYKQVSKYDGKSPYVWRQGVKHDCSKVMELCPVNGSYVNGFHEKVDIETDRLYGLLKSSDLKRLVVSTPRKYVIITQRYLGEETSSLFTSSPKLYRYLQRHQHAFEHRKSTIYKGKPAFSIFGIGDYAFKIYKVAISGLYKHSNFVLLFPENGKPCMVDDTCYFIGFDEIAEAIIVWTILNGEAVQRLLRSITFRDAKRPYTKQRLMRIGLDRVAKTMTYEELLDQIRKLEEGFIEHVTKDHWNAFVKKMRKTLW